MICRNLKYLILTTFVLILNANCLDFGCIGGGGDDYYPTRIYIMSISADNSFKISDSLNYGSYSRHEINSSFGEFDYSIDGKLAMWGYRNNSLIEHTGTHEFTDSLRYFITSKGYGSQFDLYPSKRMSVISTETNVTFIDSVYNAEHYNVRHYTLEKSLIDRDYTDTLLNYQSRFIDSLTYETNMISSPKFDSNGNIIFISTKAVTKISADSLEQNFFRNLFYSEAMLVRLNTSGAIDTLIEIPFKQNNHQYWLDVTESTILFSIDGVLSIYDHSGQKMFTQWAENAISNLDGNSIVLQSGKEYHRISDQLSINLSDYIPGINHSYPSDTEIMIIHDQESKISFFDVNSRTIVLSLSLEDMPSVHNDRARVSNFSIVNPFSFGDTRVFFYVDNFYHDDPDDPCD